MTPSRENGLELTTERLKLRRPDKRDINRIRSLADNWNVANKLGSMPHPLTKADVGQWLQEVDRDWGRDALTFGLYLSEEKGCLCGAVSLFALVSTRPAVGFWLGEPYWRRGLMTEALSALVDFAVGDLQAPTLDANLLFENEASRRVLEKNGFKEVEHCLLWSRARLRYEPGRVMRLRAADWQGGNNG